MSSLCTVGVTGRTALASHRATCALLLALVACSRANVNATRAGGAGGSPGEIAPAPAGDASADLQLPQPIDAPVAVEAAAACVNLQCRQQACAGGRTTSLSGTVFAPNGTLPLYNVAVYVPNAPLDPLPKGMTCDRCGTLASGRPVASALTDHRGRFRIENVPVGKDVPLVMQVGKWRRQVVIPEVRACEDNVIADAQVTRLPRNRREGDLPRVAVTTGFCDPLSCTIAKLGVDPAEFGVLGQDTAFTFFDGDFGRSVQLGPPGMKPGPLLWNDYDELKKYDMVAFSCLCAEVRVGGARACTDATCRGAPAFAAVTRYLDNGGRVFTSHFEYIWMKYSPDARLARAFNIHSVPNTPEPDGTPVQIDTTFPKGKALADWLNVIAPSQPHGQVPASELFSNLIGPPNDGQVWGRSGSEPPGTPQPRFVTINTPVAAPADRQCGRLAHVDAHIVSAGPTPMSPAPLPGQRPTFPASCGSDLTGGEAVMLFFLFDLNACIQQDTLPPAPPPVVID